MQGYILKQGLVVNQIRVSKTMTCWYSILCFEWMFGPSFQWLVLGIFHREAGKKETKGSGACLVEMGAKEVILSCAVQAASI